MDELYLHETECPAGSERVGRRYQVIMRGGEGWESVSTGDSAVGLPAEGKLVRFSS